MSNAPVVSEHKLHNGLKVLFVEMHTSPVVSIWAWYKVGSRFESLGTTGISHWVEHMLFKGTGSLAGVEYSKISVLGGTMNVVKDIHLDGTNVKIAAMDLNHAFIRPLIGNGLNRDVSVYVGVKTLENSGEDYRVDLIQGDLGFEFIAPELHAVWL